MTSTQNDRIAEERIVDMALAEHLGGEEPGRTPEEILEAADAAPAGALRSLRGFLEVAAAVLLVAFAAWGLPWMFAPAGPDEKPAADGITVTRVRELVETMMESEDPTDRREALLELLRGGHRTAEILKEEKPDLREGSPGRADFELLGQALPYSEFLGAEGAVAFALAGTPVDRLSAIAVEADRIRSRWFSREASLLLGEGVLAVAPWRENYVDSKHQQDLFAFREICEEDDLDFMGGLFARMAVHPAPYVRLHGIMGLKILGAREFSDVARAAATDGDSRVRGAALSALAAFGADGDAGLLARALDDPDDDVRRNAVREYGDYRLEGGEVRALVLVALEDADAGVRMAAATRIEEQQDTGALAHLIAARERAENDSIRRVLDSTIRVLAELEGRRVPVPVRAHRAAPAGGRDDRDHLRITERSAWEELTGRLGLDDAPEVDFGKEMVLVVFMGLVGNCTGASGGLLEDDAKLTLRYRGMWYQSEGEVGGPTRAWGLFVVPRSKKAVVFSENTQGLIGLPPVWTVRERLPALD